MPGAVRDTVVLLNSCVPVNTQSRERRQALCNQRFICSFKDVRCNYYSPMKNFLKYMLIVCMSFAFLPILIGTLKDLGSPFDGIADFVGGYIQAIWFVTGFCGGTSGVMLLILQLKERKADLVIAKASERDSFWDEAYIKNRCRLIFYSLFDAISAGDLTKMEPFVTPEFSRDFSSFVPRNIIQRNEIINPVDITDTCIVAGTDRIDDHLDEVMVSLTGNIVRPVDGQSVEAINFEVDKIPFQILLTLRRRDHNWLLNRLDNHVSLLDLLMHTRSKYEC